MKRRIIALALCLMLATGLSPSALAVTIANPWVEATEGDIAGAIYAQASEVY